MKNCPASVKASGFTLIEMAVVMVIVGILISITATILPTMIQSAKIKKARAVLEKFDYAMEGYISATGRCPCPDTDNDGLENRNDSGTVDDASDDTCTAYTGSLPYLTLGLSSGNDNWQNPVIYGVYEDMIKTSTSGLCAGLDNFILTPNPDWLRTTSAGGSNNQAYIIISGGPKNKDGLNGYFDGLNGSAPDVEFEIPDKTIAADYDDLSRATSLVYLNGKQCSGSGPGGPGSTLTENCSNGIDDDGDTLIDCEDPDCASDLQCLNAPSVTIVVSTILPTVIGHSLSHTFQATGGESSPDYYWSLTSVPAALDGKISINTWTGTLSGTLDICFSDSPFIISIRADDRSPDPDTPLADTYDIHDFQINIIRGNLTIRPTPSELAPDPDFTVDSSTFSQEFIIEGDYMGPFENPSAWSLNWVGNDPGGFQIDPVSSTTGRLRKSAATTANSYSFTLTATDDNCPANAITSNPYSINIIEAGTSAPYTVDLAAEWHFDECGYDGSAGEVVDSGDNALDGTAENDCDTTGSGKICRAAYFDGNNDYISTPHIDLNNRSFSVAVWLKVYDFDGGDEVIISQQESSTQNHYLHITIRNQRPFFGFYGNDLTGSTSLSASQWYHLVFIYDSTTTDRKIYLNGALDATQTGITAYQGTTGDTLIGRFSSHYLTGLMDELMIWQKALTPEEVTEIYELNRSSCSGNCYTAESAHYKMENFPWNGSADEIVDSGSGTSHGIAAAHGSGSRASQTTPSGGKLCRSASFTRIDQDNGGYLDLGDPVDADLDPGVNSWTISAWFNWDGSGGENIIYNKESLYEAAVHSGYVRYAWQPDWAWDGDNTFPVIAETWIYITTVYNGNEQILYKNGVQVFARAQTGAIGGNSSKLLIGARGSTTPRNFFGGKIDELKIYNRALAENEIKNDMEETRDCTADSVVISSTSLPNAVMGQTGYTSLPDPVASGGTPPYVWEIISQGELNLGMPDITTGTLEGDITVCSGTHNIILRVTDANSRMDESTLPMVVETGNLTVSGLDSVLNCASSTCYWNFNVNGAMVGELNNFIINWQGSGPGGFEIISTGINTFRLRKIGSSTAGNNYRFGLEATDSECPANQLDTGLIYTLNISGAATDEPYYAGSIAEWHMDECTWDGTADEVQDASGAGYNGLAHNFISADNQNRSIGKTCYGAALNLSGTTDQYVSFDHQAFSNLGDFSLAMWFKIEELSESISTLFSGSNTENANVFLIYLNASGTYITTHVNGLVTGGFNLGDSVDDNLWHHLVWMRQLSDGSEIIYLDGLAVNDSRSAANTENITLAQGGAIIGQEQDSVGGGFAENQMFHGWIDELIIFNKVLNQTEVDNLRTITHDCAGDCYTDAVAKYHMDEESWTSEQEDDVQDSSGNAIHGTPYGSIAIDQSESHLCYSGSFTNSDSYILITDLPVSTAANDKTTICFWMNWAGDGGRMPIGWQQGYDLYFHGPTRFGFNTGNGDVYGINGANAFADNWHHITAIFNNRAPLKNQLFIDGELHALEVLSENAPINRSVSSNFYISGWGSSIGYKYNGLIDELKIFSRGLSVDEVIAEMNETHDCQGGGAGPGP